MNTQTRSISEIWIYPIKSLGGIRLQRAALTERGLQWDRRWMLLDSKGQFMTQRQIASMALLEVSLHPDHLEVKHREKSISPLAVPLEIPKPADLVEAPVWDDVTSAYLVSTEANNWFSEALGQACRLVYMPEDEQRTTTGKTSGRRQKVSFADEYPILMIGQASLDDLNSRMAMPVPMNRFRPNLVFSGGTPFEEDSWHAFELGDKQFWAEKPCARCIITTIDQGSGKRISKEPLATLSKYRKWNNKLLFGQNLLYEPGGTINVGDTIKVQTNKDAPLAPAL
jgi:uncharacterized protein YcbX